MLPTSLKPVNSLASLISCPWFSSGRILANKCKEIGATVTSLPNNVLMIYTNLDGKGLDDLCLILSVNALCNSSVVSFAIGCKEHNKPFHMMK